LPSSRRCRERPATARRGTKLATAAQRKCLRSNTHRNSDVGKTPRPEWRGARTKAAATGSTPISCQTSRRIESSAGGHAIVTVCSRWWPGAGRGVAQPCLLRAALATPSRLLRQAAQRDQRPQLAGDHFAKPDFKERAARRKERARAPAVKWERCAAAAKGGRAGRCSAKRRVSKDMLLTVCWARRGYGEGAGGHTWV